MESDQLEVNHAETKVIAPLQEHVHDRRDAYLYGCSELSKIRQDPITALRKLEEKAGGESWRKLEAWKLSPCSSADALGKNLVRMYELPLSS